MASFAVDLGLPSDVAIVERESRYTMENAVKTAISLQGRRTLWVVTTPFHLRRASLWFERVGFAPRGHYIEDSVQFSRPSAAFRWVAKEYASLIRDLVTRL
jgi:uncharacterized SAM-binding protein YcdF (DUF218 family)